MAEDDRRPEPRTMTAQHKAALAEGRSEGRAVKSYLEALAAEPAQAGPHAAPRIPSRSASPPSTAQLRRRRRPLQQLQLRRRSAWTSQRELDDDRRQGRPLGARADFVKTAAKYAQRKGISYAAWRELGVPADVLKKAGISRAAELERRFSSTLTPTRPSEERLQQHDAVGASRAAASRRALGVRHQPDDVAGFVADAGDVVEAAVGVVDVADDDAVVGAQRARASSASHT